MGEYKVVDLFSGAGGMSLGFSMAGFEILLGIDKEEIFLKTFQKNHQQASVIKGDISDIKSKSIIEHISDNEIDVIIGGPPCQGFSVSGPRKFHDPRNKLFLSFVRITKELQPNAFVLENVPGLVGLFGGKIKDSIIKEFSKIGYDVSYKILIAADYGVPQLRKRVFFIGVKNQKKKFSFPLPSHFENTTLFGHKKYITCEEALSDLPPLMRGKGKERQNYASSPKNEYQKAMRRGSKYVFNHIAVNHEKKVKKIIGLVPEGGNYKDLPEEYRNTRNFHIAWTRYHSKKPASTIDTGHRHHFHYKYNRVPTVRENARLQSFPDTLIFYGNQSQQNAQVGNAVPPLMAKAIAKELYGKPDIVFKNKKIAIFCDSSFWHGKSYEKTVSRIKSNKKYWTDKIKRNIERDKEVTGKLKEEGWTVLRFWDDEIKDKIDDVIKIIERNMDTTKKKRTHE